MSNEYYGVKIRNSSQKPVSYREREYDIVVKGAEVCKFFSVKGHIVFSTL